MAVIDLSTLARKTPECRVDAADVTRLALAISLNHVYTGRDAKVSKATTWHRQFRRRRQWDVHCEEYQPCLAYRVASCRPCRRQVFVDSPRQPCGLRSHHQCSKEVAA